ncbi:MFS general substrate transporter [Aspergillus uvarum CBS 121591]|uniref:MFS general substrate transporter n=1 Tax=Aspergillus uvarum CBS 121591 TaxID=1448315 RepID=A0A319CBZ4_9EURO|nr:MFS general substrate transporter [Aspergillus uvarum CBS 121591]PYH76113.1 MFS general substrate transporter [Aspergillus uvarum CBS 121591]
MVASCAWAGASKHSYQSLLWARIFQGVALAPFEALVNACVGDLSYVHERGKRMALSNAALFGAAFLTPVLAGKITHSLGWEWTFYLVSIFTAAALPLTFFCVPETAFRRPSELSMGTVYVHGRRSETVTSPLPQLDLDGDDAFLRREEGGPVQHAQPPTGRHARGSTSKEMPRDNSAETELPVKVPYLQTLKPFNGRKTDESFYKLLLRPFPLFFHPVIFWACLIQGVVIGWTVFIGVVLETLFLGPPLWFNEVQTGYLYTGAFIESILGLVIAGLLSDWMNQAMIKLNRGRYEPEFRILLVIFQLIFSGAGLFGSGLVAENIAKYGWLVADAFFA